MQPTSWQHGWLAAPAPGSTSQHELLFGLVCTKFCIPARAYSVWEETRHVDGELSSRCWFPHLCSLSAHSQDRGCLSGERSRGCTASLGKPQGLMVGLWQWFSHLFLYALPVQQSPSAPLSLCHSSPVLPPTRMHREVFFPI